MVTASEVVRPGIGVGFIILGAREIAHCGVEAAIPWTRIFVIEPDVPLPREMSGISQLLHVIGDQRDVERQAIGLLRFNDTMLQPSVDLVATREQNRARRSADVLNVVVVQLYAAIHSREIVEMRGTNFVVDEPIGVADIAVAPVVNQDEKDVRSRSEPSRQQRRWRGGVDNSRDESRDESRLKTPRGSSPRTKTWIHFYFYFYFTKMNK